MVDFTKFENNTGKIHIFSKRRNILDVILNPENIDTICNWVFFTPIQTLKFIGSDIYLKKYKNTLKAEKEILYSLDNYIYILKDYLANVDTNFVINLQFFDVFDFISNYSLILKSFDKKIHNSIYITILTDSYRSNIPLPIAIKGIKKIEKIFEKICNELNISSFDTIENGMKIILKVAEEIISNMSYSTLSSVCNVDITDYEKLDIKNRKKYFEILNNRYFASILLNLGECEEMSIISHILLKLFGFNSYIVSEVIDGGLHASNIFEYSGKYYHIDFTQILAMYNEKWEYEAIIHHSKQVFLKEAKTYDTIYNYLKYVEYNMEDEIDEKQALQNLKNAYIVDCKDLNIPVSKEEILLKLANTAEVKLFEKYSKLPILSKENEIKHNKVLKKKERILDFAKKELSKKGSIMSFKEISRLLEKSMKEIQEYSNITIFLEDKEACDIELKLDDIQNVLTYNPQFLYAFDLKFSNEEEFQNAKKYIDIMKKKLELDEFKVCVSINYGDFFYYS